MKKYLFLPMLIIAFAVTAQAAPIKFKRFTLELPPNWSYEEDPRSGAVRLFANDKSASTVWVMAFHNGRVLMDLAKEFSQNMGGNEPRQVKDLEVTFTVQKANEPDTVCYLWKWPDHHEFLMSCDTGNKEALASINNSFQMNIPDGLSVREGSVAFDLPQGWTSEYNKENRAVRAYPGNDAQNAPALVRAADGALDDPIAEAAAQMSQSLKNGTPPKEVANGVYSFEGVIDERTYYCIATDYGKNYLLVCLTGDAPHLLDMANTMRYVGN